MSESQKPVNSNYRKGWDTIFCKCKKCNDTGLYEIRKMGGVHYEPCSCVKITVEKM